MQGIIETHEDRKRDRERGRAAEKYDELDKGKKDRHWSEKARSEMTERDWRIFREDFNIAYKGVNVSATALPLRNWTEAELPEELNKVISFDSFQVLSFIAVHEHLSRTSDLRHACLVL